MNFLDIYTNSRKYLFIHVESRISYLNTREMQNGKKNV